MAKKPIQSELKIDAKRQSNGRRRLRVKWRAVPREHTVVFLDVW